MRHKSNSHLDYIRELGCVVCGDAIRTEAAHIRYPDPRAAKPLTGMGIKPDDCYVVPLCNKHHHNQHRMSERAFWVSHDIDPVPVALALWKHSGDHEAGCIVVANARGWK